MLKLLLKILKIINLIFQIKKNKNSDRAANEVVIININIKL